MHRSRRHSTREGFTHSIEIKRELIGKPLDRCSMPRGVSLSGEEVVLIATRGSVHSMHVSCDGAVEISFGEIDFAITRPNARVRPEKPRGLVTNYRLRTESNHVLSVPERRRRVREGVERKKKGRVVSFYSSSSSSYSIPLWLFAPGIRGYGAQTR